MNNKFDDYEGDYEADVLIKAIITGILIFLTGILMIPLIFKAAPVSLTCEEHKILVRGVLDKNYYCIPEDYKKEGPK